MPDPGARMGLCRAVVVLQVVVLTLVPPQLQTLLRLHKAPAGLGEPRQQRHQSQSPWEQVLMVEATAAAVGAARARGTCAVNPALALRARCASHAAVAPV
jgi:hypothetical protein